MYRKFTEVPPEMRVEVVGKMLKTSRGRLTRLEKRGIEAPSVTALNRYIKSRERSGMLPQGTTLRNIKPGEMSFNELESTYYLLKDFLELDTSTITGAKRWEKNVVAGVSRALGHDAQFYRDMNDDERTKFWKIYNEVLHDPRYEAWLLGQSKSGSDPIMKAYERILKRQTKSGKGIERSEESLTEALKRSIDRMYKKNISRIDEDEDDV